MKKKIMILGASELQLPAILKAKELGLEVISIDYNPDAIGFSYSDKYYVVSTLDKEEVLEIAKRERIDGIITLASDLPMKTVAFVADKLNLVSISMSAAENTTNKFNMRNCFLKHNIQSMKYFKVSNLKELQNLELNKFEIDRWILKPVSNSGSRGISLITKESNPEIIKQSFEYTQSFSKNKEVIVEEYIKGREVSVESISVDGQTNIIQITDKITSGEPNFVELGHSQPSDLDKKTVNHIHKIVKNAINSLGVLNGPTHTEVKIDGNEIKIIEIGARLGGDFITTDLVPLSTNIDMVKNLILQSLKEKIDLENKIEKGSAIKFFVLPKGKKIKSIRDYSDLMNRDGVERLEFQLVEGDEVPKIENSTQRYGYLLCSGNSSKQAKCLCEEIADIFVKDYLTLGE